MGTREQAAGDDKRGQGLLLRFAGVERMPSRGIVDGKRSFLDGSEVIVPGWVVSLFDWAMGDSWLQASRRGPTPPLPDSTEDESEMVFFRSFMISMIRKTLASHGG